MKKLSILLTFSLVLIFSYTPDASALCWVKKTNDEIGSDGNAESPSSFRGRIEAVSSPRQDTCAVTSGSYVDQAGFVDSIWFATETHAVNDAEAVDHGAWPHIVLSDTRLVLEAGQHLRMGNVSIGGMNDPNADPLPNRNYTYSQFLAEFATIMELNGLEVPQSDLVAIDARDARFSCVSHGGSVWLSDVLLLMPAGTRMGDGCWRNGGHGFICDGELRAGESPLDYDDPDGADYTRWCDSDTVATPTTPEVADVVFPNAFPHCLTTVERYQDSDGDGYGDPNTVVEVCMEWSVDYEARMAMFPRIYPIDPQYWSNERKKARSVENDGDCDDTHAEIFPGAAEVCDGVDNNCSGAADDHGDFAGIDSACSVGVGSCENSGVFVCSADGLGLTCSATAGVPSTEVCANSKDDDCNGIVDDAAVCTDDDGNPIEVCSNVDANYVAIDDDGDGLANCADPDCASQSICNFAPDEECSTLSDGSPNCQDVDCSLEAACQAVLDLDQDGDGVTIAGGDCADDVTLFPNAADISPNKEELCDGIDNNCNNSVDENGVCEPVVIDDPDPSENSGSGGGCQLSVNESANAMALPMLVLFGLALVMVKRMRVCVRR